MFFPDKADAFRSFISHTSSTSKVVASMVISTAMIVAVGAAQRPVEALSPVDVKDVQKMSAAHSNDSPSQLLFLDTEPAWHSRPAASETAVYSPPESPDIEASMVSGHIQAF